MTKISKDPLVDLLTSTRGSAGSGLGWTGRSSIGPEVEAMTSLEIRRPHYQCWVALV